MEAVPGLMNRGASTAGPARLPGPILTHNTGQEARTTCEVASRGTGIGSGAVKRRAIAAGLDQAAIRVNRR
jgi:hypothetical protein